MDLTKIFDNPGLIFVGLVWMTIHVLLLILVAKLIKENKEGYKELSDVENIIKQEIRIDKKHDLLIDF